MPPARANTFGPTMHVPASFQQQQGGHPMGAGGVGGGGGMHSLMDGNRSVISSLSAEDICLHTREEGVGIKKGRKETTQLTNSQTAYAAASHVSSLRTLSPLLSLRSLPYPSTSSILKLIFPQDTPSNSSSTTPKPKQRQQQPSSAATNSSSNRSSSRPNSKLKLRNRAISSNSRTSLASSTEILAMSRPV